MKHNLMIVSVLLLFFFSSISCGRIKKTDAEYERDSWIAGFSDSVEFYKNRNTEIESRLESINARIASMLENFEKIQKPREVSGYYLLKGWNTKIPLTSTGIYARINENEKLELIATLQGANFNQIAVGRNAPEFYSEVVPHDQAFNFRHERFNTVYFEGGKADTIAEYIAENNIDKINLDFLEGKTRKKFLIPESEKNMILQTWELYATQMEARDLQRELWVSSKKIEAFRRMMEAHNSTEK